MTSVDLDLILFARINCSLIHVKQPLFAFGIGW